MVVQPVLHSSTNRKARRAIRSFALGVVCLFVVSFAMIANSAASPELMPMWDSSNESSTEDIDHSAWDYLLEKYVDDEHESGIHRFDYGRLKSSTDDLDRLKSYMLMLTNLDPRTYSKNIQMAYWINLYNALTVWVVTNDYPVESIKDIKSGLFTYGPWEKELITVAGQSLSLDNIEHNILRPIWQDPRIHYAVNCASLGCPNLAVIAFRADNLEAMLNKGATEYINHERGVQVVDGDLHVSSIYVWFQEDFGGNVQGVIDHLRKFARPELATALGGFKNFEHDYDWKLNAP